MRKTDEVHLSKSKLVREFTDGRIFMMRKVKHPCMNCKYFMVCGSTTRTEECNGRELKKKRGK